MKSFRYRKELLIVPGFINLISWFREIEKLQDSWFSCLLLFPDLTQADFCLRAYFKQTNNLQKKIALNFPNL